MNRPLFHSVFADEINSYLHCKVSLGYKAASFYINLKHFDRFCIQHAIKEPIFTTANAVKWLQKKESEATTTHYSRVNSIKQFLMC